MSDCIWCNGENNDDAQWTVCSITSPYNPEVLLSDHICPGCYKDRTEECENLSNAIMYMCDGAEIALRTVSATEEQVQAVKEKMESFFKRLAGVEE